MKNKLKCVSFNINSIKRWANSNPILAIVFVLIVIISSIITITDGMIKLKSYYLASFCKFQNSYEQVSKLGVNTQIDNIEDLLGKPYFINKYKQYKEYIFLMEYFYVQVVTNIDAKVVMYSVTTRNSKFNPKFETSFVDAKGEPLTITLGKTTFSEIASRPYDLYGVVSMNMASYYYNEKYQLGGTGRYGSYAIAYNGAGSGELGDLYDPNLSETSIRKKLVAQIYESGFPEKLQIFRKRTVINTFCVMSMDFNYMFEEEADGLTIGPNMLQLVQMKN